MNSNKILNFALVIATIIVLFIITFSFINVGTLNINTPTGSTILINGVAVVNHKVKLKPGDYSLIIKSPGNKDFSQHVTVSLFKTSNINNSVNKLTDEDIIIKTLRLDTIAKGSSIVSSKRFDDNWIVSQIGLGSLSTAVIHQENGTWQAIYYYDTYFINRLRDAPQQVQDYVKNINNIVVDN